MSPHGPAGINHSRGFVLGKMTVLIQLLLCSTERSSRNVQHGMAVTAWRYQPPLLRTYRPGSSSYAEQNNAKVIHVDRTDWLAAELFCLSGIAPDFA